MENTTNKSKRKLNKWGILSICLASLLVISGAVIGIIYGLKKSTFEIDNMVISNISSYQALGVASNEFELNSAKGFNSNKNKKHKHAKLYGLKQDNSYEEITFEHKNGEKTEQKWNVVYFMSFGNYSFITYSTNSEYKQQLDRIELPNYDSTKTYIIHHSTGKIYSTKDIFPFYTIFTANITYNDNILYIIDDLGEWDYSNNSFTKDLYKLSIENEQLKIEKLVSSTQLMFTPYNTIVDNYGNIALQNENSNHMTQNGSYYYSYVITNNKTLKAHDEPVSLFKSINGYIYSDDLTLKLNENGELVTNTDSIYYVNNQQVEYVTTIDNTDYYYDGDLYKITWEGDTNFERQILYLSSYNLSPNYVFTANRIYFLHQQNISYLNLLNMEQSTLISYYVFYSISSDNQGNVYFEALNDQLQDVSGIIKNDGSIDISVSENNFTVIYISPIN